MTSNETTKKNPKNTKIGAKATLKDSNGKIINLTNAQLLNQQKALEEESKKMEEEERKKHVELEKKIKEIEDKSKFEQQQCQNIISFKEKEREQKEKVIIQLESTNNELNEQLKYLKNQVKENFDSTSKEKEKNGEKIKSKKKKKNKLEEMLDEKEEELKLCINENKNKEKEIERLQKELDSKVNLEQVNILKNQIEVAVKKKEELDRQIEDMEPIRLEHEKCEEEKARIKNEIYNLQESLKEIKKTNREIFKKETEDKKKVIQHNNMSKKYEDLDEEKINNLKEKKIQTQINKYWSEKENEEKREKEEKKKKENSNNKEGDNKKNNKKLKFLPESYLAVVQKQQNFNKKMEFAKSVRNNSHKKEIEIDGLKNTELPKIPLFDHNKKKALLDIIPEKEIQKYEKRFEIMNKEKDNLIRKYNTETIHLKTEQDILTKNNESCVKQLDENKKENKKLESQIKNKKKKLVELEKQLNDLKNELEETKSNISNQEQTNRELLKILQRLQSEEIKEEEVIEGEVNQMTESGEKEGNGNRGQKGKKLKKEGEQENV